MSDHEDQVVDDPVDDTDRFFTKTSTGKRGAFIPENVARVITDVHPIRFGRDGRLWRYKDGVFLPDGDHFVEVQAQVLLGKWSKIGPRREVVAWFRAHEPTIGLEDQDPELINCANGLVEWRTGQLLPHDPLGISTAQIPVRWRPNGSCPVIDAWMTFVLADEALIAFAWEVIGYALYAGMPFEVAILLVGHGGNGKSTFLNLVRALLGASNVSSVSLHALTDDRFASSSLYGRLANVCGDIDARTLHNTDIFKRLTGGDSMFAQRKNAHPFEFTNAALPIFSANEPPFSSDQTDAYFRRWKIIPFDIRIQDSTMIGDYIDRLTTPQELEGALAKAVRSLRTLMDRGRFDPPDSVTEAGDKYRLRIDSVYAFITEECVFEPGRWVHRQNLYENYVNWCERTGRKGPLGRVGFNEHIRKDYSERVTESDSNGLRKWHGIRYRIGGGFSTDDK